MSGGVPWSPAAFVELALLYEERGHAGPMPADKLAWLMFWTDMNAYQKLGRSVTGATWCKGERVPYCREAGRDFFPRLMLEQAPWWARWAGRAIVLYVAARAAR